MQLKLLKNHKVLIVGCGPEQLNAIFLAKEKGLHVIGVDKNIYAKGKSLCDEFFNIDIKNKKILRIAKKINGILTVASDLAVPTINFVQKNLNLNLNKKFNSKFTTNKYLMKKNFTKNRISTPYFIKYSSKDKLEKFLKIYEFPFVVKPIFSYGQKGVSLIRDKKDIYKKITKAKKSCQFNGAIIEEYKSGYEVNIVLIVENFIIKNSLFSKRLTEPNKSFGIADQHIYPIKISPNLKKKIIKDLSNLILSLNFKSGILYPQIIINNDNYFLLEIASRVPGGFMRDLMILANGIDPIEFEILNSLNIENKFKYLKKSKKFNYVNILFLTKKNYKHLRIKKINQLKLLKNNPTLHEIKFNYEMGSLIPPLKNSTDRIGAIISKSNLPNKSYRTSIKILDMLNK